MVLSEDDILIKQKCQQVDFDICCVKACVGVMYSGE